MTWFTPLALAWWREMLGTTWDDASALWDDMTSYWDEGPTGGWYSDNEQSWYTRN